MKVTLFATLGGDGEETYIKELLAHPPENVSYTFYSDSSPRMVWAFASAFSVFRRKLLFPDTSIKMLRIKEETDLVHIHAVANKIFKKPEVPIIMSASSSSYIYLRDYINWSEEKILSRYRLGKLFYKLFNINDRLLNTNNVKHLVVWSDFARRIYLKFGVPEEKVSVVYPGMPLRQSKRGESEDDIKFLFIGDLNRKGGSLVIKAFKKLVEEYNNIKLTMVMPEKFEFNLKNVTCISYIEREVLLKEVYPFHDVFLSPTFAEGFGMTIEEAMSFSMPIISTSINAIPEMIENGKNGFLIEPGNLHDLTESVRVLIEDENVRRKMKCNTNNLFKNKFWYEKTNEALYRAYDKIN